MRKSGGRFILNILLYELERNFSSKAAERGVETDKIFSFDRIPSNEFALMKVRMKKDSE